MGWTDAPILSSVSAAAQGMKKVQTRNAAAQSRQGQYKFHVDMAGICVCNEVQTTTGY